MQGDGPAVPLLPLKHKGPFNNIAIDVSCFRSKTSKVALGRLDGSVLTLPHPDWFVFMYVRKEAVLSSQIDGTQSSLRTCSPLKPGCSTTRFHVDEVTNYVRVMNHGLAQLPKLPVSVRLIREIHAELMRGGRLEPGELRRSLNWIGPRGSTLANATFVPPPHHTSWNNSCRVTRAVIRGRRFRARTRCRCCDRLRPSASTEHGVMDARRLYESPFTDLTPEGPEGPFSEAAVSELISILKQGSRLAGKRGAE